MTGRLQIRWTYAGRVCALAAGGLVLAAIALAALRPPPPEPLPPDVGLGTLAAAPDARGARPNPPPVADVAPPKLPQRRRPLEGGDRKPRRTTPPGDPPSRGRPPKPPAPSADPAPVTPSSAPMPPPAPPTPTAPAPPPAVPAPAPPQEPAPSEFGFER